MTEIKTTILPLPRCSQCQEEVPYGDGEYRSEWPTAQPQIQHRNREVCLENVRRKLFGAVLRGAVHPI